VSNVFCAGISPLFNLCASGILQKSTKINYLWIKNIYNSFPIKEFKQADFEFERQIASFFGYELKIRGPYEWFCPPLDERFKGAKIKYLTVSDLKIIDGDILTLNTIPFLSNMLVGQKISIFPEGASCFNYLKKNYIISVLGRLKKKIVGEGFYQVITSWILPDRDGVVNSFFEKDERFKVLSYKKLRINQKRYFQFLISKFPEIKSLYVKKIDFFHPVETILSNDNYSKWAESISKEIRDAVILLKKHPSDQRNYERVFNKLNVIWIPDFFSKIPAEIFLDPESMKYLGYYSTSILLFSALDVKLIPPPDIIVREIIQKEYVGMIKILKK
jgi:hypothetical protein